MKTPHDLAKEIVDNTKAITIENIFHDDHIPCVAVKFDGKPAEFWWCGLELISSLKYVNDSKQARKDLVEYLAAELETVADTIADNKEDGEPIETISANLLNLFGLTPDEAINHYSSFRN